MNPSRHVWRSLALVGLVAAVVWVWQERSQLLAFPGILGAYSAKEYCSCRYVMGYDAQYCRGYVKQYLPLSDLDDDPQQQRVVASGLGRSSTAAWLGPREGCRLIPVAAD